MDACPHCGAPAHLDGQCAALDPVRKAFGFPSKFESRAAGRVLWIRSTRMSTVGVAATSGLVAAALGALIAAESLSGAVVTVAFSIAAGVALVVLSDATNAIRIIPGALEQYAGTGVSGQPTRHLRAELKSVEVRPTPKGLEVVAEREGEEPLLLVGAIASRPVAERLAAEISRVLALEPFTGTRPLTLPPESVSGPLELKWHWPRPAEVRVDEGELHVKSPLVGELRFDADHVEAIEVEEEICYLDAMPVHHLLVKLRKGERQRVLSGPPGPVTHLARHARALWKLG